MPVPTALVRTKVRVGGGLAPGDDIWSDVITQLNNLTASIRLLTARLDTNDSALVTLANELKTDFNAAVTDITALQARVTEARTLANEVKADHNALLAKLDADAGVTDTNYAALHTTAAADIAAVAAITATSIAAASATASAYDTNVTDSAIATAPVVLTVSKTGL